MEGRNRSRMGKISRRPMSITRESKSLEAAESIWKFEAGPTSPRPGPTLLRQVTVAEREDSRGMPSNESREKVRPRRMI